MKNKNKLFLIFLSIIFMTQTAFIDVNSDILYLFQWGLRNYGNAIVSKTKVANNHAFEMFDYNKASVDFSVDNINKNMTKMYNPECISAEILNDISFEEAYEIYELMNDKREVIVAIIDTGVDINHFELKDSVWVNNDEIPANGKDDDRNGYIDDVYGYNFYDDNSLVYVNPVEDAHGTHSAGTIVSAHNNSGIKGIAYDKNNKVKIMPLKVLGKDSKGSTSNLCKAIEYAYNNGARICNISLGAYISDLNLEQCMKKYQDMLFVVAAGNGKNFIGYNIDLVPIYPASYFLPNVITVSNLSFDGTRYESSNFGNTVDLFAPGTYILSTLPDNSFGFYTGTSMAAPFTSAVAAMIMSSYKNLTVYQIKEIIKNSVVVDDRLRSYCISSGRLNAYNAITLASCY